MADTVVLVPILQRAHRVAPVVDSIRASCDARILFCVTPNDRQVKAAIEAVGDIAEYLEVRWHPVGDYARKINAGIKATTEPLIFSGADDLEFEPGWLEAAKAELRPGIGVVGTNDLGSPRVMRGEHATHFLITREYVEQFGTIDGPGQAMAECYPHEYVDDEMVGTARLRGAWAFAAESRVRHRHPNWDASVPMDDLYAGQQRRMIAGRRTYVNRRRRWAR